MAMVLLKIFSCKDYYSTTHAMIRVLTKNECFFFILKQRRQKISLHGFQICRVKSCRQIFDVHVCHGSQVPGFLLLGGGGAAGGAPKTTFAPLKGICPLTFSKNNRKKNRNNILLFLKTMACCLLPPPLKFFQQKARFFS